MLDFDKQDFVSLDFSLQEQLVIILAKWIKIFVVMLLFNYIKCSIHKLLTIFVEYLCSIIAMWQ